MGTVEKYVTPTGKPGYLARFSFVDGAGVRRHRKRRFRTKKEAEAWTAQQEADQSRGVRFEPSREPFGEAVQRWLRLIDTPKRSARTIGLYRVTARTRLAALERVPVGDVTVARIRDLLAQWEREGLAAETQAKGLRVLAGTFELLLDEGAVLSSPMTRIKGPKRERPVIVTWLPAQVSAFLSGQADAPYAYAWEIMFAALVRIGELGVLRWEDIDSAGVLTVRRTWTRDKDEKWIIGETPKTAASSRSIPLGPKVLRLLMRERASRAFDDGGWVCADAEHAPMSLASLRRRWEAAVSASGLPRLTPHGARHSGATNLIAAGVPVSAVQRLLGHTDGGFTMRRYVHPGEVELSLAVEALGRLNEAENHPVRLREKA
jgi:integrase